MLGCVVLKIVLFTFVFESTSATEDFHISNDIFKEVAFIPHSGDGPFSNYLTMNVNFEPMADLFSQLLLNQRKPLTNRGEAHITVVTPPEFSTILMPIASVMLIVGYNYNKRRETED